jgi:hypothetical protein
MYNKWMAMPEVVGTVYEARIREKLRLVCYDSAEAKIHEFRLVEALREIGTLRALGVSYFSLAVTLLLRKIVKLRRIIRVSEHHDREKSEDPGLDLA